MSWEKLKMQTPDLRAENFKKLAELFPDAVTETITGYDDNGKAIIKRAVDADVLRRAISAEVIDGEAKERYYFTWPDKQRTLALAMQPNNKTLRLVRDKSVGRDGTPGSIDTENIYIEGDNLDALKILQETYLGKIKMIYIDPPYNTGSDLIYNDKFLQDEDEFLIKSGQADEQGNRLVANNKSCGRFHTDWLNMIYPRLKFAKELLSDDGVIFISIDDNEQANLKKICDEIFGENNFVANFVVIRAEGGGMAKQVIKGHDYLYVYAKDINNFIPLGKPKDIRGKIIERDGDKYWIQEDWLRKEFGKYGTCHYEEILAIKGQEKLDEINQGIKNGEYVLIPKSNGMNIVGKLRKVKDDSSKFYSILKHLSANGITDLKELELEKFFDYPKPLSLIKEIIYGATLFTSKNGDIILDFFSGSATTAHAVMKLNAEDGGRRKFILVQLPELTPENSEARKAGYETICDIGEERIKRAGKKIKEERPLDFENLDIGFRVFKVDSSNMQDVYYKPEDLTQGQLELLADNIKPSRTSEDLLIQAMLDMGVSLSSEIKETEINGKKIFHVKVNNNYLIACFDDDVSSEAVQAIAELKPDYAVFKDAGIANNSVMTNFDQIFNTYSPGTVRRIL